MLYSLLGYIYPRSGVSASVVIIYIMNLSDLTIACLNPAMGRIEEGLFRQLGKLVRLQHLKSI